MRLTRETERAIEVLSYLSHQMPGEVFEARELARLTGVSHPFLSKILQRLSKAGIVRGHRGNPRGYSLAGAPSRVSVGRVVEAIEGEDVFNRCIFFSEQCSERNACPLHHVWKTVRPGVREKLNAMTIDEVSSKKRRPR